MLFVLHCLQLMESGLHGLRGLHAVSPVAQEFVKEGESVMIRHRNMVGRTALAATRTLKTALNCPVLVSLIANKVL